MSIFAPDTMADFLVSPKHSRSSHGSHDKFKTKVAQIAPSFTLFLDVPVNILFSSGRISLIIHPIVGIENQ